MAINFTGIVGKLAGLGFYSFVLPWLLFFAVILGVLNVTNIFGSKRINAIISAVIAFFITAFTPAGVSLATYFTTLFGVGAMTIAVLLVIVLLGGALGYKVKDYETSAWVKPLIGLVVIALAVLAFGAATGTDVSVDLPGLDSDTWTIIFILVFVLLAIWYADEGAPAAAGEGKKDK
ncbi:MAG: hypothetical protein ABIF85_01805 [Nanoarchaeota archaeon]|nr:hypothetical protein [Nanoarchaeota archaeon]MBU4299633.1 hypothetical protein [Nanoarchaeota archaeon]MBU4452623.1 hypothetical protein [Nanoarchaeota archaeon]MCG2723910.1 hypothetical protein [archaeon]